MKLRSCILFFGLICLFSCGENDSADNGKKDSSRSRSLKIGEPIEYIPTQINTELNYVISLGDVEPLKYEEIRWTMGNRILCYVTRGRFMAAMDSFEEDGPKKFNLKLKVKNSAKKQGELEFPIGVELEVVEDGLGIYKDAKQVFLAASSSGRFNCHEVITHSPNSPGAPSGSWGSWGSADGYSMRLCFFGAEPQTSIGMGDDPQDTLLFEGIADVPNTGTKALYFIRKVNATKRDNSTSDSDKADSILGKAFEEHVYFVKGKGLVYLQQRIGGKVSMTWVRSL